MTLLESLQRAGENVTRTRACVVQALPETGMFRSEELVEAVHRCDPSIGRATVFRTLALLVRHGLVERVDEPDGDRAYRVCMVGKGEHHHHLTCTACGHDVVVSGSALAALERAIDGVVRSFDFAPDVHDLQLFGRCRNCR